MTVGAQAMPPTNFDDRAGDFIHPKKRGTRSVWETISSSDPTKDKLSKRRHLFPRTKTWRRHVAGLKTEWMCREVQVVEMAQASGSIGSRHDRSDRRRRLRPFSARHFRWASRS
jgi:hypothetical protein